MIDLAPAVVAESQHMLTRHADAAVKAASMAEADLRRVASHRSHTAHKGSSILHKMPPPRFSGASAPPAHVNVSAVSADVSQEVHAASLAARAAASASAQGLPPLPTRGGSARGDGGLLEVREREVAMAVEHDLLLERELERESEQDRARALAREREIAMEERDKEKEALEQRDRDEREAERRKEAARARAIMSREVREREETERERERIRHLALQGLERPLLRHLEIEENDSLDSSSDEKPETRAVARGNLSMQVLELTKEHDLLLERERREERGEDGSKRRPAGGAGMGGGRSSKVNSGVDKENSLQGISLRDSKKDTFNDRGARARADGDDVASSRRYGAGGYTDGEYHGVYRTLQDEKRKAGYRQAFAEVIVSKISLYL
jgi:hypothetical protein